MCFFSHISMLEQCLYFSEMIWFQKRLRCNMNLKFILLTCNKHEQPQKITSITWCWNPKSCIVAGSENQTWKAKRFNGSESTTAGVSPSTGLSGWADPHGGCVLGCCRCFGFSPINDSKQALTQLMRLVMNHGFMLETFQSEMLRFNSVKTNGALYSKVCVCKVLLAISSG